LAGVYLIRRRGAARWFPNSSPGAAVMMSVKCPGKETGGGTPVEVFPKE
jgi:hypothetical protein